MTQAVRSSRRLTLAVTASVCLVMVGCTGPSPRASDASQNGDSARPAVSASAISHPGESPTRAAWRAQLIKVQTCMGERGWDFAIGDDKDGPSLRGDTPPSQHGAMMADMQECKKQAGDRPFEEMSEALAHKLYAEVVKRGKCLSALGYDIQRPPSEAKWVAQQLAQDPLVDTWDPYDDLGDVDLSTWSKVTDACPQGGLWGD